MEEVDSPLRCERGRGEPKVVPQKMSSSARLRAPLEASRKSALRVTCGDRGASELAVGFR